MKNWKKGILGVALSFMFLFTCVGYAALTDTLSISGTVSATMPEDIFFAEISADPVKGSGVTASISGLREITVTNETSEAATATFAITVNNNSGSRQVLTGLDVSTSDAAVDENYTLTEDLVKTVIEAVTEAEDAPYYSGSNALAVENKQLVTLYVTFTLPANSADVTISYEFEEFIYKISYINNEVELDARYVYDNTVAITTQNATLEAYIETEAQAEYGDNVSFKYWMNAGSTKVAEVPAGNDEDIELYPKFDPLYTAMFVDQDGSLFAWCFFNSDNYETNVEAARTEAENALNAGLSSDLSLDYWKVVGEGINEAYEIANFAGYTADVTIYPVYVYNGDVTLIPVDTDGDGDTDEWQVGGYRNPNGQALVEIPDYVNGVPVTEINSNAFSSYDGIHSVVIPTTVTTVGSNILAEAWSGWTDDGETVTIYYAGSRADWEAKEPYFNATWESGLSENSKIFFLNGTNKVDRSQGYLKGSISRTFSGTTLSWTTYETVTDDIEAEYIGYCDCSISTTGDTAHIYVDSDNNVMGRNDEGTPVNGEGTVIYLQESGWINKTYTLTDGTNTYSRFRPDIMYWTETTP